MTIREQTQALQAQSLSEHACLPQHSRGRARPEEECPIRTPFARDRDRVIHSKAFRRPMHKTQVFLSPEGDHYRTRLTHTLEVNQIAKTLAVALRLNEELTEAIALGHDLGHTPFGHAGERALREVCPHGFSHAQQSVRVADRLEKGGAGLNLTWEVRNGIACHSYSNPSPEGRAATLEGRAVYFADKIAYLNHDLEDALRARVLCDDDIPVSYTHLIRDREALLLCKYLVADEKGVGKIVSAVKKADFHKRPPKAPPANRAGHGRTIDSGYALHVRSASVRWAR